MDLTPNKRRRVRRLDSGDDPQSVAGDLNTAQSIAHVLREQIHSGELRPNARVTQRDLAAQFGRSPMPARDAVKMLLAEGLVVQEGSKTIVVAPANREDFAEIMELRALLEPRALALSIPRMTAEDLAAVRAVMALSGTTDNPRQMAENHWRFHRVLYRRAARPRLLAMIRQQQNLMVRYLLPNWAALGVRHDWARIEYALMDLVEQRRVDDAVEWLRRDLEDATSRVLASTF
jgi:DNA-binding GntR family transcriptional regulator